MVERELNNLLKVELPVFSGEDVIGWLFRVERYFTANRTPEEEKVSAVVVCLEGKAINWFQWLDARKSIITWKEFKRALLHRFHYSQVGDSYEMVMGLSKTGHGGEIHRAI